MRSNVQDQMSNTLNDTETISIHILALNVTHIYFSFTPMNLPSKNASMRIPFIDTKWIVSGITSPIFFRFICAMSLQDFSRSTQSKTFYQQSVKKCRKYSDTNWMIELGIFEQRSTHRQLWFFLNTQWNSNQNVLNLIEAKIKKKRKPDRKIKSMFQ